MISGHYWSYPRYRTKRGSKLITRGPKTSMPLRGQKDRGATQTPEKVNISQLFHLKYIDWHSQCVRTGWGWKLESGKSIQRGEARKRKVDEIATRRSPWSSKTGRPRVCLYAIFTARISDEQKFVSDGGEKDIGKYRAAHGKRSCNLSEEEVKRWEAVAIGGIQCHFQMIVSTQVR